MERYLSDILIDDIANLITELCFDTQLHESVMKELLKTVERVPAQGEIKYLVGWQIFNYSNLLDLFD